MRSPLLASDSQQRARRLQRLPLQMHQPHHHVRNLHARVVDVVLHPDNRTTAFQHPNECVAENCVSQMTDMAALLGLILVCSTK